jgi:hypothetical protein
MFVHARPDSTVTIDCAPIAFIYTKFFICFKIDGILLACAEIESLPLAEIWM